MTGRCVPAKLLGMRRLLLLSALALACSGPVSAAETGKCDAKPFTLTKPAPPVATTDQAKQPSANERETKSAPSTVAAKKPPADKPRLLATCKDKAKKA